MSEIFLLLSAEVSTLFGAYNLDLTRELERQKIRVTAAHRRDPTENGKTRDAVLVLLASSVPIYALGVAIANIIGAFSRRPVIVTEVFCRVARGNAGEVLRNLDGSVALEWVETQHAANTDSLPSERSGIVADVSASGLRIELQSKLER